MGKLHDIITTILSTAELILGCWGGYELAGILGAILFTPVGAFVGLTVGALHIRLLVFID